MYPQSFLFKEAQIKQRTFSKKQPCEIGEEAIWDIHILFDSPKGCKFLFFLISLILHTLYFVGTCL